MFPQPTAPPASYSTRPYVGRGRSFNDRKGFKKPGGRGRGQGRSTLTVSVSSDSKKRKVESQDDAPQPPPPPGKPSVIFEGTRIKVINNEGVLPPQMTPVGGRLSNFVEVWKCITNDPYVPRIVAKGYRLRFTSPPLLCQTPWEIRSPQGPEEILGMREQITLMLQQKNAITEVPPNSPGFYSSVFLVRKASGGWRPVKDLKNLNAHIHAPHFRYVHDKLCFKLRSKRRLHVQNRPARCVLSRTYPSQKQ